jgi:hypothetical protein
MRDRAKWRYIGQTTGEHALAHYLKQLHKAANMPKRSKWEYFVLQVGVDGAGRAILVAVEDDETFICKEKGGGANGCRCKVTPRGTSQRLNTWNACHSSIRL